MVHLCPPSQGVRVDDRYHWPAENCLALSCRPHERTGDELRRLANFLSQEVPWFAGLTQQLVIEVGP